MNGVVITGLGAVSPAGWGVDSLIARLASGDPVEVMPLERPGWTKPLKVRRVPTPASRPTEFAHPRLRRSGLISQFAAVAAVEALTDSQARTGAKPERLGIVFTTTCGGVNYTRRFYKEVTENPPTASPLLFPETVFNAPSSHVGTLLQTPLINYTLVGDSGVFLQGLAVGARWLLEDRVDACLVLGSEEIDWATADVVRHFSSSMATAEGAAALVLQRFQGDNQQPKLERITEPVTFANQAQRFAAADGIARSLQSEGANTLLMCGATGVSRLDQSELQAWASHEGAKVSPKVLLGEGFAAGCGWQCVAALDALRKGSHSRAMVSSPGAYRESNGASFIVNVVKS